MKAIRDKLEKERTKHEKTRKVLTDVVDLLGKVEEALLQLGQRDTSVVDCVIHDRRER
jgi:hypothetical protein